MNMGLKTSTKISIKFTVFTILIVFLFGILLNVVFLQRWYTPLKHNIDNMNLINNSNQMMIHSKGAFREYFKNSIILSNNSSEYKILQDSQILDSISGVGNLANIDDSYFYFQEVGNKVIIIDITEQIRAQKNLILVTLYLLVFFGILSYIVSLYFVKSSLNKLNDLIEHVQKLDVDSLNQKIKIIGPKEDEINILAIKMNTALDKIHKQTLSLKDFITNASHELKTPLMAINSEIDYSIKSKKYKQGLDNVKKEIISINNLLDELVLISKIDANINLDKKMVNISDVVEKNLKNISKKYKSKKILVSTKIDSVNQKVHNSSFDIISKNLIENAFKYTNEGTINIILNDKYFEIKDTGKGIDKKNLNKIWERFWQEDTSKTETGSFGLGLYLTKLLVEKHGRKINVKSTKGKGSEFKIIF